MVPLNGLNPESERQPRTAGKLPGGSAGFAEQEAVVTIARDIAQAAVVGQGGPDAATSRLIANADHALLSGNPTWAVALLARAAS